MLRPDPALWLVAGALALAAGIGLARTPRQRALAALLLAGSAGALSLSLRLRDAAFDAGAATERRIEASVAELRESGRGTRVLLDDLVAVDGEAAPLPRRLLLLGEPGDPALRALPPGARVRAQVRLRRPQPLRNPGRRGDGEWLAREGIGALALLADPALLVRVPERDRGGIAPALHPLRRRAADRLLAQGAGGGLLAALALGDRSGLSGADEDAFARLGLSHLLSVSGLHLAIAAALAYGLCAGALRRSSALASRIDTRHSARVAAVAAALVYALLTGFEVPVRRSFALVAASALALGTSRTARAWHPLAAAGLWVLAVEPEALFEAGPQLSFAACAALIAAARHAEASNGGTGLRARLASLLRATAAASLATAPIAAWHGLPAAPLALPSNAIAVPWTGVALMPASLAGALLAALPQSAWSDVALRAAARVGAASLAAVAWGAQAAPSGGGTTPSRMLCLLGVVAALAFGRARATRVLCAAALALALAFSFAPPGALPPDLPRLVALDVGAGDALLVQGRAGALLVDGGPALGGRFDRGRDTVVPALRALGVSRLDLVVASHADLDHRGGLPAVLDAFPVGALWLPEGGAADDGFGELLDAARAARVPVREVSAQTASGTFGDLHVTPLWPPPGETGVASHALPGGASPALPRGARNERSLGLRVDVGTRSLLLLGDVGAVEGALVARAGPALRADLLVLPHHGSRRSSSEALLAAADAEVAIVSAPCRGRHPHRAALARAQRAGASLWWTGRDGALLVGLGEPFAVLPWASPRACGSAH